MTAVAGIPATLPADYVGNSDLVADRASHLTLWTDPPSALAARRLHERRQLHRALDHGFAMLDAIGLGPAALDEIDRAIRFMDEADGDTDAEPWLGWTSTAAGVVHVGDATDREEENEHGTDLDAGEADTADDEPCLGAPIGDGDQCHWSQGDARDVEDVNPGRGRPYSAAWREREPAHVPRLEADLRAMARRAQALKRGERPPSPARPWSPPGLCNVTLPDGRPFVWAVNEGGARG